MRALSLAALVVLCAARPSSADSPGYTESLEVAKSGQATVGVPVEIAGVVWPGSELEVTPVELATPVVVRITDVYPHGDALRYDLTVYGLDPGEYDLTDFVRRVDGSSTDELEPLPFEVLSILPPGQVEPNPLHAEDPPVVGGYTRTLWIAGIVWVLGLIVILSLGRRRRAADERRARPASLADRLQPLVEDALAGRLSREDRAALELTLIAVWRKRLGLDGLGTAQALSQMKQHDEAGPLLRKLEEWLHRPATSGAHDEPDLTSLLAPYKNLPADAFAAQPAR